MANSAAGGARRSDRGRRDARRCRRTSTRSSATSTRWRADVAAKGLRLRPHAKSHKTPEIAKLQVARGAVGVCCQKVDEAAAFVEDGSATCSSPTRSSRRRSCCGSRNSRGPRASAILVDDARAVAPLAQAAQHAGVTIDAYVEVDVGAGRCGVLPGEPAARLALQIVGEKGPALSRTALLPRRRAAPALARRASQRDRLGGREDDGVQHAVERAGLQVPIVTGAGTGTWEHELASGVWNELQVGSYIFMDADYARNTAGEARRASTTACSCSRR
jgi:D-serine deaminase-like pyridoxal phosphate-dependent protein